MERLEMGADEPMSDRLCLLGSPSLRGGALGGREMTLLVGPSNGPARMLKKHLAGFLSYIWHRLTNALAEGVNSKIETIEKMASGFRNREHSRAAIPFRRFPAAKVTVR